MIEKIMKSLKSGNKKRSLNISIGAVVGFLLSCSAIMGADYLWIKNDGGIKFSIDNKVDSASPNNPYAKNVWNESIKTYVNNIALSGTDNREDYGGTIGCGLKLSGNLEKFKFINNSSITGTSSTDIALGIANDGIMGELTNNGSITGEATGMMGSGIANSGTIGELANNGLIKGTAKVERGYGISNDDTITELTNNGSITGEAIGIRGSGIENNGTIGELINNGLIKAKVGIGYGYGISNEDTIRELTNKGIITGTATGNSGYGINNTGIIEKLLNNGLIKGKAEENFGIGINNARTIRELTNTGLLAGTGAENSGYGIYNTGTITELINKGLITGMANKFHGYGIYNTKSIETLLNTGVIYGTTNAILNGSGGTIDSLNNYGLLVSGGTSVMQDNSSGINKGDIYGLAFTVGSDEYKLDSTYSGEFGRSYDDKEIIVGYNPNPDGTPNLSDPKKEKYTIINAKDNVEGGKTKGTDSLELKNGELKHFDSAGDPKTSALTSDKKYILNGITDTLLVSGNSEKNALNNIVINAYKTAVAFDTSGGTLSLSGTIVNGGIGEVTLLDMTKEKVSILGSGNADALILQNTIVNGNINMQGGLDTLTIGNGTLINGTIDGGLGDDTLNFVKSSTTRLASSTDDNINILHNITGFENMNINTNVTLFEQTIGDAPLTVTGVDNITIGAGGVLTLRIDGTDKDSSSGAIIGHALYGNDGTISSTGGKILLALNGVGENEIISFGSTELDSSIKGTESVKYQEDLTIDTTSWVHSIEVIRNTKAVGVTEVKVTALSELPLHGSMPNYKNLNEIYQGIISATYLNNFLINTPESFSTFLGYLTDIYAGNPYSYSSELSRKSMGIFRDIVTENQFRADTGKWLIHGGLTHIDGGTKDTYYGKGYYTYDVGNSDIDADTKITGAYMLGEYGVSDTLTSGVVIGGNKLKSDLSNGSKVEGNAMYLGAYAKKYLGNLKVTAGAGFQYGDYDADRLAVNNVTSDVGTPVMKYSDNYNDMTYDIYINGRYSHNIGDNLFLEPYGTLSYSYVDQDGADEGSKDLAIETDSKSFDYTTAKVGMDLKKVIPHEKGKSTVSVGVNYTRILDGADEEFITGRFKGGTDFDILVAHKNEHSIGLNAKYSLELENGVLFDVKGTYAVERDSHNNSGKNKTKDEWIVGAGMGYKF